MGLDDEGPFFVDDDDLMNILLMPDPDPTSMPLDLDAEPISNEGPQPIIRGPNTTVQVGQLMTMAGIDLMHWRHKGSRLHNNGARLVLCWQCALATQPLSARPRAGQPGGVAVQGLPPWLHAWRWRTWQCLVWPPTQLGALLWRHMHMVYSWKVTTV